ncbi:MAG: hypothetical protein A2Y66_02550 [Nitrospirae bacterium RBG_13_41_22]|nr:MAG: hypothetical protein A2Y66_02550 [Nitrospirae bacterium RBG_13_41_22]
MRHISKILVPSMANILFLSVFLIIIFSKTHNLLNDGDTGYHIRAGEYIIQTFSIPRYDMFSFLTPPIPWTAHEWLSEVAMALLYKVFGLTGVVIFFAFFIACVFFLFFKIIQTYTGNILICILVSLFVITSSQVHWLARPHIFSLLLFVIWYYLLDIYHYKNKNYLYLFPPIMLLWVNLHGGFVIGFILIGIYLFGNLIKFFFSNAEEKEEYKRKTKLLGMTAIACLLVSLINPYSYQILLFPLKLISNKFIMDHVNEFLPPNFHESMPFKYMLLFMIAVFAISRKRINIIELALIVLFTNMSLYSARYIPLFAIVTAPILVKQIESVFGQWDGRLKNFLKKRAERIASVDASANGYVLPCAAILLTIFLAVNGKVGYTFDEKEKPVAAVEFLKGEHIKGNMFNNDEFGDYIIYAAWPEYKVFFDGRSDMYGVDRMKEYFKVTGVETGWDKVLKKYNINWIIYDANSYLSRFLLERVDWKLIYADKVANIFVRNTPEYQSLIDKYKGVKPVIVEEKDNIAK